MVYFRLQTWEHFKMVSNFVSSSEFIRFRKLQNKIKNDINSMKIRYKC